MGNSNLLIAQSRPLQGQFSDKLKKTEFTVGAAVLPHTSSSFNRRVETEETLVEPVALCQK